MNANFTGKKLYNLRHSKYPKELLGQVELDFDKDTCTLFLLNSYKGLHPDWYLMTWSEKGQRVISGEEADEWLSHRVCPPGRHNIDEVLKGYGLNCYSRTRIIAGNKGVTDWDDFWFEEVNE